LRGILSYLVIVQRTTVKSNFGSENRLYPKQKIYIAFFIVIDSRYKLGKMISMTILHQFFFRKFELLSLEITM